MFKSKEELNGEVDPKIYRGGRSHMNKIKDRTRRQQGREELVKVLNKIKPLSKKAIQTAYDLMTHEDASETNRLRAAAFLIDTHHKLVKEIYLTGEGLDEKLDGSETEQEEEKPRATLHLHVKKEQE